MADSIPSPHSCAQVSFQFRAVPFPLSPEPQSPRHARFLAPSGHSDLNEGKIRRHCDDIHGYKLVTSRIL